MFNVTIINAKSSLKRIAVVLILTIITFYLAQIANNIRNDGIKLSYISEKFISCLDIEIPAISNINKDSNTKIKEDGEEKEKNFSERILRVELSKMKAVEKSQEENNIEISENVESNITEPQDEENTNIEEVKIETVTQNPIKESSNLEIAGVKIKNETSYEINEEILSNTLEINKKNIVIFHTHTCESYTPSEAYNYEQTGNFRTTDLNYSVARVGDELEKYLIERKFNVYHDKTYHDYPAYTGSYKRSLQTVENVLKKNNSDIIIDLHRDAIGSKSNYDPSVKIGEDVAAKMMFVIGTNGGGLYHPNWENNLQFAIQIQKKANEMYPGLFKPIIVRNSRYNQHLGKAACIIEVGATGNTLEQCLNSMKYLSQIFDEALK